MDALLTALVACFICELGDRGQYLALTLAERFRGSRALVAGIGAAALANAAVSAIAGGFIAPMLGSGARTLLLAAATAAAGVGLLSPVKPPDPLSGWRIGAFLTGMLGLFILGFGNGPQFLAFGIAVRTADPVMTGIGAGIGTALALLPVIFVGRIYFDTLPIVWIRRVSGALLLLLGIGMALASIGVL
jgi:putative Ca2+/H+ antiporter (TMEM165/GDT1 family)